MRDWVRIQDPITEITHHAYQDNYHKTLYITECNLLVTTDESTETPEYKAGWIILDPTIELTCDDCLEWISMGPIDEIE